jgi:hypothetical protein
LKGVQVGRSICQVGCRRDQRGVALILALLVLLILTLLGINAIQTTTFEASIAGHLRVYNLAFNAADGGIDSFRGMLSLPSGHPNRRIIDHVAGFPSTLPPIAVGESICRIRIQDVSDREEDGVTYKVYTIRCEGVAPGLPVSGEVAIEAVIEAEGTEPTANPPVPPIGSPGVKTSSSEPVTPPVSMRPRIRSWREIF